MTDPELLELAAKASEFDAYYWHDGVLHVEFSGSGISGDPWNPITDDGDALRLAVGLRLDIDHNDHQDQNLYACASRRGCEMMYAPVSEVEELEDESQRPAATRRAIVRAAAEIAREGKK